MEQKVPPAVKKILKEQPYLTWGTTDKENISLPLAVSSILNYGDWNEVKKLFKSVGLKKVKGIFQKQIKGRNNYNDITKHYFTLYFKKHA